MIFISNLISFYTILCLLGCSYWTTGVSLVTSCCYPQCIFLFIDCQSRCYQPRGSRVLFLQPQSNLRTKCITFIFYNSICSDIQLFVFSPIELVYQMVFSKIRSNTGILDKCHARLYSDDSCIHVRGLFLWHHVRIYFNQFFKNCQN